MVNRTPKRDAPTTRRRLPRPNGFILLLLLAVAVAIVFPKPGTTGGPLHWDYITTYGVSIVFFLYGLTLAPERMKAGLAHWRGHIAVVLSTFGLFPLVVLAAESLVGQTVAPAVATGFFYIAALPSTVSSSVAMTSMARGDVPVAIFNATISSLIGVLLTPLLMAWYLSASGAPIPLLPTVAKVVLLVLVPIGAGQLARLMLAGFVARHARWIKYADRAIILAIVYGAFSNSVAEGVWRRNDPSVLVEILVGVVLLFFIIYGLTTLLAWLFRLDRGARIAVQFCGSKKSLAAGVPLAPVIFAGNPSIGLIIVPIMLFHFCQLLIVSVIASQEAKQAEPIT